MLNLYNNIHGVHYSTYITKSRKYQWTNDEKYIKKQLEFILNQTLPIDEIIICDDRSQDNTIQLIKELKIRQKIILSVMNVHLLIVFQLIER